MLVDVLLKANRRSPKKLAVSDGMQSLTYGQLTRLAVVLRDVVLRETRLDKVGIMMPASGAFPGALFGVLWASKIAVPLNFLLTPAELSAIVKDSGLDLILTIRHFRDLASKLPARTIFLEDLALKRKLLFAMFKSNPPVPQVDDDATAVILYTSGTTAEPKGVELSHANLHSNCVDSIHSLDIDPDQTFLNILPPSHVFGLTALVLVPVFLGATVHAIPRFSPSGVVRAVERKKITIMLAIPSMYAAILRGRSAKADSFRSIFLALSGGEPLPDSVRIGFKERFAVTLQEGYGMTETSPIVAANSLTAFREGTVGRPIRNVEVRIVSPDREDLPRGEDGEIHVKGPGVMKGYYNKPEETRKVLDPDGWLATGDVGRFDTDGFLTITGRAKDMLIIGGENVFPREIEAVLEEHQAVLQAAVIGMSDDLRGEAPVAFVIPEQGTCVTEQDLRGFAKKSLAGFKVPKRIIIREDLPQGPTGKILKRRLHG